MSLPIGISASRGASILGLSGYQSKFETWQKIMEQIEPGFNEKNKYKLPEEEKSPVLEWGKAFESSIIELAEEKIKFNIINREKVYKHKNFDFVTCHIDGEYFFGFDKIILDGNHKLHEGKTTSIFMYNEKWGEPGTERVPIEYQIQAQHQLLCSSADEVIISVLVFPNQVGQWEKMGKTVTLEHSNDGESGIYYISQKTKNEDGSFCDDNYYAIRRCEEWALILAEMGNFHQYIIKPNKKLQDAILGRYNDFWNLNIINRVPPEPSNYDDIRRLYTEPKGTIIATPELESLAMEYAMIQKEIGDSGSMAKRQDQIKTMLIDIMRKMDSAIDDESREKTVLRNAKGDKLLQFSKSGFRISKTK